MKKIFTVLTVVLLTATIWAQSPQKMSYQAVVRNSNDHLVTNQIVGIKISILLGSATGAVVYTETQTTTTNANGLVSIEIGGGAGFNIIDWSVGTYFIKTETDPTGGVVYTITGISQLLSVPYALHTKTAETLTVPITESDPIFISSPANGITNTNITNWATAYGWGNHTTAGYLTSYTETDPLFSTHVANGITGTNISNWNTAFSWGNHSAAGYLTNFTETDPIFTNHPVSGITAANITNWSTAYSWGNHAGLYRPISYVPSWSEITGKPSFATVATSGSYNDLLDKPTVQPQTLSINGTDLSISSGNTVSLPAGPQGPAGFGGANLVYPDGFDNLESFIFCGSYTVPTGKNAYITFSENAVSINGISFNDACVYPLIAKEGDNITSGSCNPPWSPVTSGFLVNSSVIPISINTAYTVPSDKQLFILSY